MLKHAPGHGAQPIQATALVGAHDDQVGSLGASQFDELRIGPAQSCGETDPYFHLAENLLASLSEVPFQELLNLRRPVVC